MTEQEKADIAAQLRRTLRVLGIATVALYLVVVVAVFLVYRDANQKRDALRRDEVNTTAALCALRVDVERRIESSQGFLKEHPDGIPGFNAAAVKASLVNSQRTVKALSGLTCQ